MISDVKFIPGTQGAYALSGIGTMSRFHQTSNPYAAPVAWNDTDLNATYTRIVPELNGLGVYVQGSFSTSSGDFPVPSTAYNSGDGYNTGISLVAGVPVAITATGTWGFFGGSPGTCGPDGNGAFQPTAVLPSAAIGTLLYRIGTSGSWAIAGSSVSFSPSISGTLYMICNDLNGQSAYDDNFGFVDVSLGISSIGLAITSYSDSSGETFNPIKVVGVLPSGGMDTIKIGTTALAGAGSQIYRATSGGDWTLYAGTLPLGAQPTAIFIPRWQFGGTITPNINTSTPQYLLGSGTLSNSGESLWKATGAGSFTAISPKIGGTAGKIVGPDALSMNWNSGTDILAIADFTGSVKLCVSNDTGNFWKFTDLNNTADEIAMRRSDLQHQQAIIANGSLGGYVPNYQGTVVTDYDRFTPTGNVHAIDVLG